MCVHELATSCIYIYYDTKKKLISFHHHAVYFRCINIKIMIHLSFFPLSI